MNAFRLTMMALATTSIVACGGGGGSSSPEDAAKALVSAIDSGDTAAVRAAFVSEAALDAALDCKDGEGPWPRLEKELAKMDRELAEMKEKKMAFAFKSMELKGEPQILKAGEEKRGCTAKSEVQMARATITMAVTKDGETRDDGEGVQMMKLDGKWYILDM